MHRSHAYCTYTCAKCTHIQYIHSPMKNTYIVLRQANANVVLVFVGAESFGLYSCVINGEERDQTHRAVYR